MNDPIFGDFSKEIEENADCCMTPEMKEADRIQHHALAEMTHRELAAVTAQRDQLLVVLQNLLALAEEQEQRAENEWGRNRSLAQVQEDGHLPDEIMAARAALAAIVAHRS